MKIAVTGHNFVQEENRARWERFADMYPDCTVTLLVPSKWETERYGAHTKYQVKHHKSNNYEVIPLPQWHIGREFYFSYDMALRRLKPDILHIVTERFDWKPYQALLFRSLWSPETVTVGYSYVNIDYKNEHIRHKLKERAYFGNIDSMCAGNREAEKILRLHGFKKPILVQQENGADERIWYPVKANKEKAGRQEQVLLVGYVGALLPEKAVSDLAKALIRLDADWTWTIVGDGNMRAEIASILSSAGALERARFMGYRPRGQIPALMRAMDVLVLPSRTTPTWKEQFGLVLAEAMLSGVAVIGSDSGAIPEVIGDTGLVFPEGDVDALAACLQRIKDKPVLRRELAERGRRLALEKYSVNALAKQSYDFFNDLLVENHRVPRRKNRWFT